MTSEAIKVVYEAYEAANPLLHRSDRGQWVMSREWYDRIRSAAISDEQENARAIAHARALITISAEPPLRCPACGDPFAGYVELSDHVRVMSDPQLRDPSKGERLLGLLVDVQDDGGPPHIESRY